MTALLKPQTETVDLQVSLPGRDSLELKLETANGNILTAKLTGRGCTEFLKLLQTWRPKLTGALLAVEIPRGNSHGEILLREALLKARGEWKFPYAEEELCHCRAIATGKVDAAIIGGCRSVRAIARETSAGTSCGSCRPDTETIINYRLSKS